MVEDHVAVTRRESIEEGILAPLQPFRLRTLRLGFLVDGERKPMTTAASLITWHPWCRLEDHPTHVEFSGDPHVTDQTLKTPIPLEFE
jgi:hypothetical protein